MEKKLSTQNRLTKSNARKSNATLKPEKNAIRNNFRMNLILFIIDKLTFSYDKIIIVLPLRLPGKPVVSKAPLVYPETMESQVTTELRGEMVVKVPKETRENAVSRDPRELELRVRKAQWPTCLQVELETGSSVLG